MTQTEKEIAVFGGGCFWCGEAIFQRLKGVESVTSGYAGRPEAEVIKVEYHSAEISFETLLSVFFSTHDPTTLNRQGADIGEQYRSAIFYANEQQREDAEKFIAQLTKDKMFQGPIVTELVPFADFREAEEPHQNFYNRNRSAPYCQVVIDPKLQKLQQQYAHLLK